MLAFGANSDLTIPGHHVAAKTGTTNDFRDNLTVGYTPNLAVAVWVGNADHSPMRAVTGIVGVAPIFNAFMSQALAGTSDAWYPVPPGLHTMNTGGYIAYLLPGTEQVAQAAQPPPTQPPSSAAESKGHGKGKKGRGGGG
jgi:membrane peptidoglycan carboxypeptidase